MSNDGIYCAAGGTFGNLYLFKDTYIPGAFTLSSNASSPERDGNFSLYWTESDLAQRYSIYNSNSSINNININTRLLIEEYNLRNYSISNLANGTHYFIILASNTLGTRMSNCLQITVDNPSSDKDKENGEDDNGTGENDELILIIWVSVFIVGSIAGIVVTFFLLKKRLKPSNAMES